MASKELNHCCSVDNAAVFLPLLMHYALAVSVDVMAVQRMLHAPRGNAEQPVIHLLVNAKPAKEVTKKTSHQDN